jgi:hypothetical protein
MSRKLVENVSQGGHLFGLCGGSLPSLLMFAPTVLPAVIEFSFGPPGDSDMKVKQFLLAKHCERQSTSGKQHTKCTLSKTPFTIHGPTVAQMRIKHDKRIRGQLIWLCSVRKNHSHRCCLSISSSKKKRAAINKPRSLRIMASTSNTCLGKAAQSICPRTEAEGTIHTYSSPFLSCFLSRCNGRGSPQTQC